LNNATGTLFALNMTLNGGALTVDREFERVGGSAAGTVATRCCYVEAGTGSWTDVTFEFDPRTGKKRLFQQKGCMRSAAGYHETAGGIIVDNTSTEIISITVTGASGAINIGSYHEMVGELA
jgi:hypothetical protein